MTPPQAAAAPHPLPPKPKGMSGTTMLMLGMGAVFLGIIVIGQLTGNSKRPASSNAAVQRPAVISDPAVEEAAVVKFRALPDIRHAEWLNGNFIVAVSDNGRPWQPVAELACGEIRNSGKRGPFSVAVLEAGALSNQKWNELARARCN